MSSNMTLWSKVGKNCYGQKKSDVLLVQIALKEIRDKKYKPYYQGRLDSLCKCKTIDAIERFQCDQNVPVTGVVEAYGRTINCLRQKTPMKVKTAMGNSGGGGHGASGTQDAKRVTANTNKLADAVKSWPLPKKETESLAKAIKACSTAVVPLRAMPNNHVDIDNSGRFVVRFDIESWGLDTSADGIPVRRAMITKVCDIIGKADHWQKGDGNTLSFKSANPYKALNAIPKLVGGDKTKLGMQSEKCPVKEKCAAAAIKQIKANKHKLSNEVKSDIFGTVTAVSEGVWDGLVSQATELDKNFMKGKKLVTRHFQAIDILYTSGKIVMRGNGSINEKIVVGEIGALLGGWAMSLAGKGLIYSGAAITMGAAVAIASPTIALIAAVVGTAFVVMYLWFDWDQWVAKNAPEWWERIKDSTILAYLEATGALSKLKKLVEDWSKQMQESLHDFLLSKFELAYVEYGEAYATKTIGQSMKVNDWIDPFINKLLNAAGVPVFNQK